MNTKSTRTLPKTKGAPARRAFGSWVTALLSVSLVAIGQRLHGAEAAEADELRALRRGVAILERAAIAAGGSANLSAAAQLRLTLEGSSANPVQGRLAEDVDSPRADGRFRAVNRLDEKAARYFQETTQDVSGGLLLRLGTLIRDGASHALVYQAKKFTKTVGPGAAPDGLIQTTARFVPALLLKRAMENRASVRFVGEAGVGADATEMIAFSWDARTRFVLGILKSDARTAFLEAVSPDALDGDAIARYRYFDVETVGALKQPRRISLERRGVTTLDLRVTDAAFGPAANGETDFNVPPEFIETPAIKSEVRRVADRLYEIGGLGGGLYRTQFIDADDGVIVFDAPLGYAIGQQVVRLIQGALPGKRVATVVISHFHSDHAGGVQAFVDAGAEVVAAAPIRAVLERYAKASSVLTPARPGAPVALRFRGVENTPVRVGLSSGAPVEAHRVETPHARDMLVLVDSSSQTVIQGDLYSELSPFNETFSIFAKWLAPRSGSITRVLGTHNDETPAATLLEWASHSTTHRTP